MKIIRNTSRDEVEPLILGIAKWQQELTPASDSAFANDIANTNLDAILRQHGLENVRRL